MNRREVTFLALGLGAGAANDLHGMRNAGEGPASYFVLRWTSPGKEGPKPGGSR